ncbi:MAG: adenine deaminase [Dehalococcoidia bacterium]|nr:adenine deaminase [Dehalococcoidia bacterium]
MDIKRLIAVARGDEPADLLFRNARVVNTFTAEIEETHVAIAEGRVAGLGEYTAAQQVVDLRGRHLTPGLIDGHVHVESSYLNIDQYARAVVPRGTLALMTDLHENANVAGLKGMRYVLDGARGLPLDIFVMAPSCVPATDLETSGATLGPKELAQAMRWRGVLGLGEMMNFPGVIQASDDTVAKAQAAGRRVKDGHAPKVRGKALNAYLAPLIGSDHETTSYDEGLEKLRRGMHLMIREGSTEKNLEELLLLVTNETYHRCLLVVDDRNAKDLLHDGDLDAVVRKAIRLGLDPIRAIQLATLNPARYFRLEGYGAVAPGYVANLLVVEDLTSFDLRQVYYRGRLVAQEGKPLFQTRVRPSTGLRNTVRVKPFTVADLSLRAGTAEEAPVIEIVPGQIVTRWLWERPLRRSGAVVADVERDLLKLVVVERHHETGNVGVGLVKGLGLKRGAIATSFAHDSHNIVAAGVGDEDIYAAAQEVMRNQGGLVVVVEGRVVGSLPLPIAGLLSPEPLEQVAAALEDLERHVRALGCQVPSPFSVLSFLALPVIPELKLTDKGLVDVMQGKLLVH